MGPETEPLLSVGSSVGGWRVIRRLGAGGMAEVYLASHPRLARQDVIKVLRPWLARDVGFHRRFQAEADRLSTLSGHAHIVSIFDQLEEDGLLFLVLQYAPGGDLRSLLTQAGRLPMERVLDIGDQVASALDAGHALGIIHRDVKPENVLLKGTAANSAVMLSDFGISYLAEGAQQQSTLTQSLMTPIYAAPEQFELQPLDGRADQYSLACMLYELLSSQPPFVAPTPATLMKAHLLDPVQPLPHELGLPPDVDEVLRRALAKSPEHRFPNCTEFLAALRWAAGRRPTPPGPLHQPPPMIQQRAPAPPAPRPPAGFGPPTPGPFGSGHPSFPGPVDAPWSSGGGRPWQAGISAESRPPQGQSAGRVLAQVAFFALPILSFGFAAWAPALWTYIKRRGREELTQLIVLAALLLVSLVLLGAAGDSGQPGYNEALDNAGGGVLLLTIVLGELSALRLRARLFVQQAHAPSVFR